MKGVINQNEGETRQYITIHPVYSNKIESYKIPT
jgi:hypothetical protein